MAICLVSFFFRGLARRFLCSTFQLQGKKTLSKWQTILSIGAFSKGLKRLQQPDETHLKVLYRRALL